MKYIGIDQYGKAYLIHKHPRKELLEHLFYKNANKMYVDGKDKKVYHTGYVIGPYWITVYGLEGEKFRKCL